MMRPSHLLISVHPSEWWREVCFAVVGAIALGGTAWARMSIGGSAASRDVVLRRPHLSSPMGAVAPTR
jgi:hypothetical protein